MAVDQFGTKLSQFYRSNKDRTSYQYVEEPGLVFIRVSHICRIIVDSGSVLLYFFPVGLACAVLLQYFFRYSTKALMQELFKDVAKHWRETNIGQQDCAKFFVDRGGVLVSSGVEGGYTPDGIMTCHMFMLRAESASDLAVLLLHHLVSAFLSLWMGRVRCLTQHDSRSGDEALEAARGYNMRTLCLWCTCER